MTRRSGRVPESVGPETRRTAVRIAVQTAALVTTVLLLVGAVVFVAVIGNQRRAATDALQAAVQVQHRGFDDDDRQVNVLIAGIVDHGRLQSSPRAPAGLPLTEVMGDVADSGLADRRTVLLPAGRYDVLTVRAGDRVVQAAYPLLEQHRELQRILAAMAVAGAVGVVLAGLAGVWLARGAVRPMAEALALQRRFVSDAGHELRTPLTLLSTRVQLLRRRVESAHGGAGGPPTAQDAAIVADADGIVRDTLALGGVLEELLTAADTRTAPPSDPVDVAGVADQAVQAAAASAAGAGRALTLSGDAPAVIEAGSAVAVKRAVTALVDNALDHAESGVEVLVTVARDMVEVSVADDGPGLAPESLPSLFDRFSGERREDARTGRRHYGLGLALVSEVAARHGGTVSAENLPEPAHGAILRLRLPRRAPAPGSRRRV